MVRPVSSSRQNETSIAELPVELIADKPPRHAYTDTVAAPNSTLRIGTEREAMPPAPMVANTVRVTHCKERCRFGVRIWAIG